MPITTTTFKLQNASSGSNRQYLDTALSMATSLSKSVGSECKIDASSTSTVERYYVSMAPIGYPGWCVYVTGSEDEDMLKIGICVTSSEGVPNYEDSNVVSTNYRVYNDLNYKPFICVMIFDNNRDTVCFDIHPGTTMHGDDLGGKEYYDVEIFFGKDVNDEVLCGVGTEHIWAMRTKENSIKDADGNSSYWETKPIKASASDRFVSPFLLLTKMINYLSTGYPEMKSAYISVIRPIAERSGDDLFVSLLYANGKAWGRAGGSDSWGSKTYGNKAYFPIEPYVNY